MEPRVCVMVCVGQDGELLETVGELASALGIDPKIISKYGADNCLCGADLDAAAKASGKNVRNCTDDPGYPWPEYIFE